MYSSLVAELVGGRSTVACSVNVMKSIGDSTERNIKSHRRCENVFGKFTSDFLYAPPLFLLKFIRVSQDVNRIDV